VKVCWCCHEALPEVEEEGGREGGRGREATTVTARAQVSRGGS
jgi:hypothetical protein